MTLGKKLANYRKLSDLTQQQLGDYLNISAQAVSKWENDLAEPDLATLRALATLYKVSIDELIDLNEKTQPATASAAHAVDSEMIADTLSNVIDEKFKSTPETIGYCKVCGIAVTEENLGVREPLVKCKRCLEDEQLAQRREKEKKAREEAELKKKEEIQKTVLRMELIRTRKKSLVVASIVTAVYLIILICTLANNFSIDSLLRGTVLGYCVFSFIASLFYDTAVIDVITYMCSASIKWPGLIFTWDIDGFLWAIGMKLLFAILGFLFGLACSVIGIILGLLIAPFVFPYIMIRLGRDISNATVGDYYI